MNQLPIVDRQMSADLEEYFLKLADEIRQRGQIQMMVVAMAATIQRELLHNKSKDQIPHSSSLDNIMRAVEHALRGDPEMNSYVLEKLDLGVEYLHGSMEPRRPFVVA